MTISDDKKTKLLAYLNDPQRDKRLRPFMAMISRMGKETVVRASITLARQALFEYESYPHERLPAVLVEVPRRMVAKAEQRIDNLEAPFDRESEMMTITGPEEPELLALQDGLINHARWFSICLHALMWSGPDHNLTLDGLIYDVVNVWPDQESTINLVADDLLIWTTGTSDPLKDNPTVFPKA